MLPPEEGAALAPALYVADFLGHWGRALGVRRMPLRELQCRLGLPDALAGLRNSDGGGGAATGAVMQRDGSPAATGGHETEAAAAVADGAEPMDADTADTAGEAAAAGGDGQAVKMEKEAAAAAAVNAEAAAEAEAWQDEADADVTPIYELYEALLRVLLQVRGLSLLTLKPSGWHTFLQTRSGSACFARPFRFSPQ